MVEKSRRVIEMMEVIYNRLVESYKKDYYGYWVDKYEGQNKLSREAHKFAIKNTIVIWSAP